jgi:hypothetical protein
MQCPELRFYLEDSKALFILLFCAQKQSSIGDRCLIGIGRPRFQIFHSPSTKLVS